MTNEIQKLEGEEMPQGKVMKPHEQIKHGLASRKRDFESALPAHISFEKFQRTVLTACYQNPDLLSCDRPSLFMSALKCATDGLLPDGREAAFVLFNTKIKEGGQDRWVKKAQYIPMWTGILKKIRQSDEVESVRAHVVYEADLKLGKFEYVLGDDERIIHEPYIGSEPKGGIVAAYCIAKMKSGDIIREVMTFEEIEKVRRTSKSGNDSKTDKPIGIWRDWYEEMARKTVFRRASKWLPQCSDLIDQILSNDASMQDLTDSMSDPEIMDSNPKTDPDVIENEPQSENDVALIENNPETEMQNASPTKEETGDVVNRVQEKTKNETYKKSKDETYVPPMDDEEIFTRK